MTFFIVCFFCQTNGIAQVNNTFSLAAKLVRLQKSIKTDSLGRVLLQEKMFEPLQQLLNPATCWQPMPRKATEALVLHYYNTHVVLEYLEYAAKNKTIVTNKLIEKSLVLRRFKTNMTALAETDLPADSLVQAMLDVEAQLAKLPAEYNVRTNGAPPPNPPKKPTTAIVPFQNEGVVVAGNNLLSTASMGIPSQSALIVGAADFLAERFKTELTLHYLQRMQENIDNSELKYLFPSTRILLNYNTIANQQQLGTLLKTAFEQDLAGLTTNFVESLSQSDGFAKHIKSDSTLSQVIRYTQGSAKMMKEINKGIAPTAILEGLSQTFNQPEKQDFDKIIGVVNLMAKNFVVQTALGEKWLDESYLRANDTLKYVLALTYHQQEGLMQQLGATPAVMATEYATYYPKMRQTLAALQRVEQTIKQHYTKVKNDTIINKNIQYEQYIAQMTDLVRTGFTFIKPEKMGRSVQTYLTLSDKIVQTQQAAEARQYGIVLNNLVYTLDYLQPEAQKTESYRQAISQIVLYGSFMLDVCNAKTEKQIKAILDNYALPVGSYSVKRRSALNVGLQAYTGGFIGGEYLSAAQIAPQNALKTSLAFAAPIGLDVAFGTKKEGAFSAFISVIDLGAVVSFRLNDPLTRDLPELKFENILAPGLHLFYGLPKTPISIGAGLQLAPSLRQYTATNAVLNADYAVRFGLTAAVDIPIFSFYNRAGSQLYQRAR